MILYRAERLSMTGAKVSIVEFALHCRLGPCHDHEPELFSQSLDWTESSDHR